MAKQAITTPKNLGHRASVAQRKLRAMCEASITPEMAAHRARCLRECRHLNEADEYTAIARRLGLHFIVVRDAVVTGRPSAAHQELFERELGIAVEDWLKVADNG